MKGLALALGVAAAALTAPAIANSTIYVFRADLTGLEEFPPNASPGSGTALVTWDDVLHTAEIDVTFGGLIGTVTTAHIHAPVPTTPAGSPTFPVATRLPTFLNFPSGVTAGVYNMSFSTTDPTFYNQSTTGYLNAWGGVAGAEAALLGALHSGDNYFNIHTNVFPGGEIRGTLTLVPEPGTWALMILGFGTAGLMLRRRRAALA